MHDSLDRYSLDKHSRQGSSVLHRMGARRKLLLGLALIVMIQAAGHASWPLPGTAWAVLALLGMVLAAGFAVAGIGARFVTIRLAWCGAVLAPWAVLTAVVGGSSFSGAGLMLKGLLSFGTVLLLINTTPYERLLAGLARLGVPTLLVATMAGMYRYGWVLLDELTRMRRAREARTFVASRHLSASGLRQGSQVVGMLLVRAAQRAQRVHGAMLARGYDGRPRGWGEMLQTHTEEKVQGERKRERRQDASTKRHSA